MKKFNYPALVIQEAKNLRKLATREEKDQLNLVTLNPRNEWKCIYGQMTGSCFSDRAEELIVKSCQRVYKFDPKVSEGFLSRILSCKPKMGKR